MGMRQTNIRIGIIAGDRSNGIFGKLFLSSKNDGLVDVTSAISTDADSVVILPFHHKEIHQIKK